MTDATTASDPVFAHTSCVHCGAVVAIGEPSCRECGAALEGSGSSLFSTVAADYAEVVSDQPKRSEGIWSTAANVSGADGIGDEDIIEEDAGVGELLDDAPRTGSDQQRSGSEGSNGSGADPAGAAGATRPQSSAGLDGATVFSAEPVPRADDVVDEPDDEIVDVWDDVDSLAQPSPFSSGSGGPARPGAVDESAPGSSTPIFGRGGFAPEQGTASPTQPATETPTQPTQPRSTQPRSTPPPFSGSHASASAERDHNGRQSGSTWSYTWSGAQRDDETFDDPHGYGAAISRLSRADQDASQVALTVAGALLGETEVVRGVVSGQMLGHAAVVVVTDARVLVVNDRRWDPIVDSYTIDATLTVRGRHDGQVAAMNFADDEKFSMVDAIHDVALSIELADTIRTTQPRRPGD